MYAEVAVAKVSKYATRESGDTVEMVERPHGGLSVVLVDGQRSGKSAKAISNIAARKVIALLSEGARDGVAVRAAHDYLYAMRGGKVRADLQLLSLDLDSKTMVVARNTDCGALSIEGETLRWLGGETTPIGIYRNTRPLIHELPIAPGHGVVIFSDGIRHAGSRHSQNFEVEEIIAPLLREPTLRAAMLADALLEHAVAADSGFPQDDQSVVVLLLHPVEHDPVRRLTVTFPLP